MAYATQLTISTGNKVSLNFQSQEVSVTLTYQLEREDADVLAVVKEKTAELAQAHRAAWQTLRDARVSGAKVSDAKPEPGQVENEGANSEEAPAVPSGPAEPAPRETPQDTAQEVAMAPSDTDSPPTPGQFAALLLLLTEAKWSEEQRRDYVRERFGCESLDDLTGTQVRTWLLELQRAEREAEQQRRFEKAHRNGASGE